MALLRAQAPKARQMLQKLIEGRIVFTPNPATRRYALRRNRHATSEAFPDFASKPFSRWPIPLMALNIWPTCSRLNVTLFFVIS
jgi:hypothetical protein